MVMRLTSIVGFEEDAGIARQLHELEHQGRVEEIVLATNPTTTGEALTRFGSDVDRVTEGMWWGLDPVAGTNVSYHFTLRRGDVILHEQPGGGGHGDPLAREPERGAEDVRDEKISLAFARREHGVVLDPVTRPAASTTRSNSSTSPVTQAPGYWRDRRSRVLASVSHTAASSACASPATVRTWFLPHMPAPMTPTLRRLTDRIRESHRSRGQVGAE